MLSVQLDVFEQRHEGFEGRIQGARPRLSIKLLPAGIAFEQQKQIQLLYLDDRVYSTVSEGQCS